jgi:hypothetical protein
VSYLLYRRASVIDVINVGTNLSSVSDGLNLNLNINLTEYVISLYMDLELQISASFARTIYFMLLSVLSSKIKSKTLNPNLLFIGLA